MFPVATDLKTFLVEGVERGEVELDRLVVVEEAPRYPGELIFQPITGAENLFYSRYQDWVSYALVLSELYNLPAFVEQLDRDGYQVVFGPSCVPIFEGFQRWAEPLLIEGYELYGFQQFSLRRAYEQPHFFFNWATGAGKSLIQAVAAKDLFRRDEIDLVIACTTARSTINQARFYESAGLDVVVNNSGHKPKRLRIYGETHQVYVMNYEKLVADFEPINQLVMGRRVLWVFDEVSKIVTGDKKNRARKAFEEMWPRCVYGSKVWPMSASVVGGNPLRYRDVFNLGQARWAPNPLGTPEQFTARYAEKVETYELLTAQNKKFSVTHIDWDLTKLQEVRHRVGKHTQVARKTDPGIAHLFKDMQTVVEPIQMSTGQRKLAEAIIAQAQEARERGETMKPFYDMLRYTATTPLALRHTKHEVGRVLAEEFGDALDKIINAKLERLNEQLAEIRDEGDQCLVFCHWTELGILLIKDRIDVPHVVHMGSAHQSVKEAQAAQDRFKTDPDLTCFLTSDAGKEGLNMQCARTVIQLDPTYSYDDTYQRASRIHRADSHLDGLTNIVYVTENSVEERVWKMNLAGRLINEAIQGSHESLNFGDALTWADRERAQRGEAASMGWMIFGNE